MGDGKTVHEFLFERVLQLEAERDEARRWAIKYKKLSEKTFCSECREKINIDIEVPHELHQECYCDMHDKINRANDERDAWKARADKYQAALERIVKWSDRAGIEWVKRFASDALKDQP